MRGLVTDCITQRGQQFEHVYIQTRTAAVQWLTCLFAGRPTSLSPLSVNATTDGVVRAPSAFSMTLGFCSTRHAHQQPPAHAVGSMLQSIADATVLAAIFCGCEVLFGLRSVYLALHDCNTGVGGTQVNADDVRSPCCMAGCTSTAWGKR